MFWSAIIAHGLKNIIFDLFSVIQANMILISRAFRHQFVIPDFPGFTKYIEDFYWRCKSNTEGKVREHQGGKSH